MRLGKGEAKRPKACVINASQIKSVDRRTIRESIGTLSGEKMALVEAGFRLVMAL